MISEFFGIYVLSDCFNQWLDGQSDLIKTIIWLFRKQAMKQKTRISCINNATELVKA